MTSYSNPRQFCFLITAMVLGLCACAPESRVREVTLANLVLGSEHFVDRQVTTEGVVGTFAEPRHYWIEDDANNRVALTPPGQVEDLVGTRVRVTGTFRFRPNQGRFIDIDTLVILAASAP